MANKMKITVISAACCNPSLALQDQEYISKIKEVLSKFNVEAQLEIIAASDAVFGLKVNYVTKLMPLFKKYGMSVAPALFINDDLVFYGGVPSIEKLTEAIQMQRR